MAEANPESTAALYFCHMCFVEITPQLPAFVCPRCQNGFIEPVEGATDRGGGNDRPDTPNLDGDSDEQSNNSSFDMDVDFPIRQTLGSILFGQLSSAAGEIGGDSSGASSSSSSSGGGESSSGSRRRGHQPRTLLMGGLPQYRRSRMRGPDRAQTIGPMLQDLIVHISTSGVGGDPLMNIFSDELASNPGDYAWGRSGLDTVISHFLNQMEGNGPPPLSQTQINSIPSTKISEEQIKDKLQCSVCMEDFTLSEEVKQLKCEHCFHDPCIKPWLQMHATCPVCRKSLNGEGEEGEAGNSTSSASEENTQQTSENRSESSTPQPSTSSSNRNGRTTSHIYITPSSSEGGGATIFMTTSTSSANAPARSSDNLSEEPVE